MEENKTTNRIHPLVAGAAISVMLVSLTGVAAITGLIPASHGTASPVEPVAAVSAPAPEPKAMANQLVAAQPKTEPAAQPEKKPAPRVVEKPRSEPRQASRPSESLHLAQARPPAVCVSCGRIEDVQAIRQEAPASGVGMVAGALLGGVLGNQVGGGNGRKIATVAGAVGGGYAGNEIEKQTRANTSYQVRVRMEDGSMRSFPYAQQPGWNVGDPVRVVNGQLAARG